MADGELGAGQQEGGRRRISLWFTAAAVLLPAVVAALGAGLVPSVPCLWREGFGVPCPGCGLTRSVCALVRGDPVTAVRLHPLGPLCVVALVACGVAAVAERVSVKARRSVSRAVDRLLRPTTAYVGSGLFVLVWLVRLALDRAAVRWFQW